MTQIVYLKNKWGKRKPCHIWVSRSMDKNMLKSSAIYGVSCYYTSLRIISNYPDTIVIRFKNQRESICPTNRFSFNKTSVFLQTNSFINFSDRTNNNGFVNF